MVKITLPYNYTPRGYQLPALRALDSGYKRVVLCWHRRSGKDVTILNWVIKRLIEEVSVAYYVTPSYSQGKKIIWDAINMDGFRILDHFPREIVKNINQQEMKIRLVNGSLFQIVGSDNIDSLVGTNPKILVFSEFAVQSKMAWDYLRPIVKVNGGTAIFISTPRGKNHFWDIMNIAKESPKDWFSQILTIVDTGVLSKQDIEEEIRDGMSEELAEQEYYCSFERGVEGSYYLKLIDAAQSEGRICRVGYEKASPVNTSWDIGFGDSTSVIFWQQVGGEVRLIDFYECHGEGFEHYAKMLKSKPYDYGKHYFPHDAGAGSIQTGKNLVRVAYEHGIQCVVLPRDDFSVGVEAVRALLSICFIDAEKCRYLVKCLTNYHKKYNEKMQCYSDSPVHDWASHACDSVRYLAMARQQYGRATPGGELTPDKIKEMRQKYLGY